MRIVKVNTSAWIEEDFILLTNISDEQISKVIGLMVLEERASDTFYSNDDYFFALKDAYPDDTIEMFLDSTINTLTF